MADKKPPGRPSPPPRVEDVVRAPQESRAGRHDWQPEDITIIENDGVDEDEAKK